MKKSLNIIVLSVVFLSACSLSSIKEFLHDFKSVQAKEATGSRSKAESYGYKFGISTQGSYSTQAAKKMFEQGGNTIDAAVAASFVLAVERPHSTGLGGGGFFLYYDALAAKTYAIDFRERAPLKATKNMFLNESGEYQSELSKDGPLAGAVPGLVAGLTEVHNKWGELSLDKVLAPSIELAEKGFPVYKNLARALKARASVLKKDPDASHIFLNKNGEPWDEGQILVQPQLAQSLRLIAKNGKAGFYKGPIAQALLGFSRNKKGLLTQQDLDQYTVKWRNPVHGNYKGYEIYSMPPPSSGGVHVLQFLNILENADFKKVKPFTAEAVHLAASTLQLAFADRAQYLGDPDFVSVPTAELISKEYAKKRFAEINLTKARHADEVKAGQVGKSLPPESSDTTHLSIIDQQGNAVATTQTINGWMGAGVVIPGTGILLNNEMDDFSAKVGTSNLFGAIGSDANSIVPGKTPLSSMSPTIVLKEGKAILSVGAPGGTRIISCVAQTILNYLEYKLPLFESIAGIRYHHQWRPDVLEIDPPGLNKTAMEKLTSMSYEVKKRPVECYVMAVAKEKDVLHAVADPRDIGTSSGEDSGVQ